MSLPINRHLTTEMAKHSCINRRPEKTPHGIYKDLKIVLNGVFAQVYLNCT